MRYTVGQMAKRLDVPASTLRYYEKEGLLPSLERTKGGQRIFRESDYGTLLVIDCLKKSGLSIPEIRDFIRLAVEGDSTIEQRLELFRVRREAVLKQMEELRDTLAMLDYKCWYYESARQRGGERAVHDLPLAEIPEEHRAARERLDMAAALCHY